MSSYGSLSKRLDCPAPWTNSSDDTNDRGAPPTEQTPLLSEPAGLSIFPGSGGILVATPPLRPRCDLDDDVVTVSDIYDEEETHMPILSKVTSNTPLGIEAEAIPATAISPDEYGDFRLPKADDLRLQTVKENVENGSQLSFHGGISKRQFWFIFAGILIANFAAAFDSTIMASTHTSITSAFHASELASWLSTSFLLTSTSFQPLYGRVSDVVGRRMPFVFACSVFTISTVWCAMATTIGSLIAARAVCGLGAGGMLTMGAIVLSDILPIEIRGAYQSVNNLAWGAGSVFGAATGGFLADALGWRWEFGIQVPFGLFCMATLYLTIPDSTDTKSTCNLWERFKDFDYAGSVYLTTSMTFLILGMNLGGNVLEWTDWRIVSSLALGLALGTFLIRAEKKAKSPVMPLKLLSSTPRGLLVFNNFFALITINAIIFNLPLYFQAVLLESATKAGTRLLAPSIAGTTSSVATGLIITRTGKLHTTLYGGSVILILGSVLLCVMPRDLPSWTYFLFLVPCNLGISFTMPSALLSILATSPQTEQAVATSTLIMWRSLGGVFGVASSSLLVQNFLYYFLEKNITGPGRREVIEMVRKSVTSIFELDELRQRQAILSYEASLRYCFMWSAFASMIAFVVIIGIRLPNIKSKDTKKLSAFATGE